MVLPETVFLVVISVILHRKKVNAILSKQSFSERMSILFKEVSVARSMIQTIATGCENFYIAGYDDVNNAGTGLRL